MDLLRCRVPLTTLVSRVGGNVEVATSVASAWGILPNHYFVSSNDHVSIRRIEFGSGNPLLPNQLSVST